MLTYYVFFLQTQ